MLFELYHNNNNDLRGQYGVLRARPTAQGCLSDRPQEGPDPMQARLGRGCLK